MDGSNGEAINYNLLMTNTFLTARNGRRREEMRPKDLKVSIKTVIKTGQNLLITSAPGTGKTEICEAVADEVCKEVGGQWMVVHPVTDDPSDWKGLGFPSLDRTSACFLPYGNLKRMIEAESLLIVIIDDVGQSAFSVQAAIMQVVRERSINGQKISDFVRFLLCTNRKGDKAGVQGVIEPLKSRTIIVTLEVNDDDWRAWANSHGMPPSLIAFSKLRPNLLHDFKPTSDMVNSANPRGWGEVGRLQIGDCPKHLEYELFTGCNGEQFATEYCAFMKVYREMPDPDAYIKDPDKDLPLSEHTLYALCAALSAKATKKVLDSIYKLAMRLDGEFSTFLVFSMVQRDKNLAAHAGMAIWAKKFASYLN
jgi:hypothetical protein